MDYPNTKPYNLPTDAVWFITGCSSGIGEALAAFVARQCPKNRVVATARNPASLSAESSSIPDGGNILKIALDVTSIPSVDAAFDAALREFGRVDVVVNNAGYTLMGDTEIATDAEARAIMDTNFWGSVDVTKRALGVFRDANPKTGQAGGVILNISSMGGFLGSAGSAFYHASKFATEGFAEAVAKELRPDWGIHVCNVEPGGVKSRYVSSARMMARRHEAYAGADMPTSGMLAFMGIEGLQERFADAEEAARAMVEVVGSGRKIPMRLPLGADSWGAVMREVEGVKREFEEWKELSCGVGKGKEG